MKAVLRNTIPVIFLGIILLGSCTRSQYGSQFRQWQRDKKGRKEVLNGPANMVYIPGGTFVMGEFDLGTVAERNTLPHEVTVEPFYLDRTEVSNQEYLVYLNWLRKNSYDLLDYRFALPDTQCWYHPLAYNEPMVRAYLRHPAYQYYPVVGVSWVQANSYCEWRTARINELDSLSDDSVEIRLPTEAEWEFAALANYGIDPSSFSNRRSFSIRLNRGFGRGKFSQNFQRGRGDMAGLSHRPNDGAFIPGPVYMYEVNEYGLYNIYGNVSEWVSDIYSAVTVDDIMEPQNENDSLYNDSTGTDGEFVTPGETFAKIMDSLGIDGTRKDEVETDITGDVLRVYKGASWRDRAYYLTPGTRRFLPQNASTNTIGFRCASTLPEDMQVEARDPADLEAMATPEAEATPEDSSGAAIAVPEGEEEPDKKEKKDKKEKPKKEKKKKEKKKDKEETPEPEPDPEGGEG